MQIRLIFWFFFDNAKAELNVEREKETKKNFRQI